MASLISNYFNYIDDDDSNMRYLQLVYDTRKKCALKNPTDIFPEMKALEARCALSGEKFSFKIKIGNFLFDSSIYGSSGVAEISSEYGIDSGVRWVRWKDGLAGYMPEEWLIYEN